MRRLGRGPGRRSSRVAAGGLASVALGLTLMGAAPVGAAPVAAAPSAAAPEARVVADVEGPRCLQVSATTTDQLTVKGDNAANLALHVEEAQALVKKAGAQPGQGVQVVVVDSGIDGFRGTTPVELPTGHGFAVAGIIAGPDQVDPTRVDVGIAPGADVLDARFYDTLERSQEGQRIPMAADLAQRLGEIAAAREGGARSRMVVVVPAQVPYSADLETQVDRLVGTGVLLVAASGDRPSGEGAFPDGYEGEAKKGEDAADVIWPAAHPKAVAVGVSTPGSRGTVLRSSAIDLAAPGYGAVSKALNGGWCVVDGASTSWAAAQVAGVAALVWSAHPDEDADQLRTRLEQTASGNGGPSSPITGYGVVQPVEAIQRDIADLGVERTQQVRPAKPPRAQADVLAGARHDAIWWGLGGGTALVVLLLLRPLLARRR
ncbi:S8 family serine peptidase [Nocardioides carbamazepini]|uniref:S8 family serine peptidase n=1 Tax=Nocardioides carbamazepini TaxID=2854259 RepID=UPI00214A47E8|nr:S8 family serine peptidase [Nocardioides carbamazepini]MCR1783494.1 S8 family serine peptidase [Nocardioides carbamazepini]